MARTAVVRNLRPVKDSIEAASRRFLDESDLADGTRRVYGITLARLSGEMGPSTALDHIATEDLRSHLARHYGKASPATFNRNLATLQSFFGWATRRRLVAVDPTLGLERKRERRTARQAEQQRAIPQRDLETVFARKDIALREKTLWRLLYDTGARANEILSLDIGDLDLAERSAAIVGKGGHVERVHWATGTARLLPRLLGDRTSGPVFLTERAGLRAMPKRDVDVASGHVRLSYRRAAQIFTDGTGYTLHQLRHSRLTHLAEDGVDVSMLKALSRHRSLRSLERYVRPSEAAVARLVAQHDSTSRRVRR